MTRQSAVSSAIQCGCATVVLGPICLYSLLSHIVHWIGWFEEYPSNIVASWFLAPYWPISYALLLLLLPFSFQGAALAIAIWLGFIGAYFLPGALLGIALEFMVDRFAPTEPRSERLEPVRSENGNLLDSTELT